MVLILFVLAIVGGFTVLQMWGGVGPARSNMTVVIPEGASLTRAAGELEKAGAITSAQRFVILAKIFGGGVPIRAGEYRLLAHQSQSDILSDLQGGKTLQLKATIPEGKASIEVYDILMSADGLTGPLAVPAEGSVLPDTYAYTRGDTRQSVVDRMQKAMVNYLAKAWQNRKPGIAVDNPRDALILASIIEKETAKAEERRLVAAVYSNRLKRNMKLDADPTIIYPVTKGKPLGRRILRSERDAVNDYNTYTKVGLPIGPIANPSRASIDAALDPARSNAIFFVADGTGGSVFADTLEQHNANVAKWYAIRRARGEM